MREPLRLASLDEAVSLILERAGQHLIAAIPLGLGKPNRLVNALYARVKGDPALQLDLYTALSLARPKPKPGLEARFAGPFIARHFGADYPDLEYVRDLKSGALPERVRVREFYFQSGAMLGNARAQRDYASLNYTHVAREVASRGVNVILQMVARRGDRLSLSCNTDVTLDLLERLRAEGKPRPVVIAVVHPGLPFIGNDAEVGLDFADAILEEPAPGHDLFALPREPVLQSEFALGLHASALVRDGGSLQIGIGALSDALVHALLLRHQRNDDYRAALNAVRGGEAPEIVARWGGQAPFARGLYGASEMVMDGFMHLRRAGILTRRVFGDLALQRLLNAGAIGEVADDATLDRLIEAGLVPTALDRPALEWLMRFGLLPAGCRIIDGVVHFADGASCSADLLDGHARATLSARMRGARLRGGHYLHGAFFLGSRELYRWLGALAGEDFDGLSMTRVSHINELYGGRESLEIAQREQARFFNTCMMQTLSGAAVSDALADGQVVSGVGGQYNFVAMAHALPNGRSILMLRAARESNGQAASNIVWNYAHATVPRHLRDVVVTEYGVADLRGESDEQVIIRLLAITDARFIDDLVARAKRAGKLAANFVVPDAWRRNTPNFLRDALAPFRARGLFDTFPFGSDFDPTERELLPVLQWLKRVNANRRGRLGLLAGALVQGAANEGEAVALARLGLDAPKSFSERLLARVVLRALRAAPRES